MSETLQPGAYFKIGETGFEYQGTRPSSKNPAELEIVARTDPEKPVFEGAVHTTFSLDKMRDAIRIGPFNKLFPYSAFIKERNIWQDLFPRKKMEIPNPPAKLVEVLNSASEQGITSLEAHFLPNIRLEPHGLLYYDHRIKYPFPSFWKEFEGMTWNLLYGQLPAGHDRLPNSWVLLDNTPKPEIEGLVNGFAKPYPDDQFRPIFEKVALTLSNTSRDIPPRTFSPWFVDRVVLPEVDSALSLDSGMTVVPSAVEYNVLSNLFHPEWAKTSMYEFTRDKRKGGTSDRYALGSSLYSGFEKVTDYVKNWSGFRPMIVFPDVREGGDQ